MREFLLCSVICLSANLFAARQITVTQLPEPLRPLAEVETNIAFTVGSPSENKWTFTIELAPSVSNCVEVVFGVDKNSDEVLSLEEGRFCVGWDCGEWFWRDRYTGEVCNLAGATGLRKLNWVMQLNGDKMERSVSCDVFDGNIPKSFFDPKINLMRIVSRGADNVRVESKISLTGFFLFVR